MRLLIPGISGAVARKVALRLRGHGHQVAGIDSRPWPDAPDDIEVAPYDLRKRAAEEVWRRHRPEAVIHMATVNALSVGGEERGRLNLGGTRAVFERCHAYGVRQVVFVGRHTYYGAGADSTLYYTEDEPPERLGDYPELADLAAADLYASTALWRYPEISTSLLRVCYTLGPSGGATLGRFLRGPLVPTVLGYDPLFQLLHEEDAAAAIVLALEKRLRGVFNVAGPQPLPLSVIIRQAGRTALPIPEPLFVWALGRAGLPLLARGALSHIKYPIVVDGEPFRRATGFTPRFDGQAVLRAFREACPVR